jgi:hypothetical protein
MTMDVRDMSAFQTGSFNAVFDKGTLHNAYLLMELAFYGIWVACHFCYGFSYHLLIIWF